MNLTEYRVSDMTVMLEAIDEAIDLDNCPEELKDKLTMAAEFLDGLIRQTWEVR